MSAPVKYSKWWHRWMRTPSELKAMGVVGLNMRNARYLLPNNPRSLYRLVDDKLMTKALAESCGLRVPETYAVVRSTAEIRHVLDKLPGHGAFVIKPARGSGGKGVLVIDECRDGCFIKPSGQSLTTGDLRNHMSNIMAGLFSLGGNRDCALIEYRVRPCRLMTDISYQGAPDIRLVTMHGYPVMAMLRTATKESDGRANLHQGAIGIGVDLITGRTTRAVHHGRKVTRHPDLDVDLIGLELPGWNEIVDMAVTCQEMTGLGYLGVDMMIDESLGPLMIEVNARPGLAIQMANGLGLSRRLDQIHAWHVAHPGAGHDDKIAFIKQLVDTTA